MHLEMRWPIFEVFSNWCNRLRRSISRFFMLHTMPEKCTNFFAFPSSLKHKLNSWIENSWLWNKKAVNYKFWFCPHSKINYKPVRITDSIQTVEVTCHMMTMIKSRTFIYCKLFPLAGHLSANKIHNHMITLPKLSLTWPIPTPVGGLGSFSSVAGRKSRKLPWAHGFSSFPSQPDISRSTVDCGSRSSKHQKIYSR